jgi:hypothetical protein
MPIIVSLCCYVLLLLQHQSFMLLMPNCISRYFILFATAVACPLHVFDNALPQRAFDNFQVCMKVCLALEMLTLWCTCCYMLLLQQAVWYQHHDGSRVIAYCCRHSLSTLSIHARGCHLTLLLDPEPCLPCSL